MDTAREEESSLSGMVVYLFAFDMAHDMKRDALTTLLGQPVRPMTVDVDKRSPRELFFHRPQCVKLPEVKWDTPLGLAQVQRQIKVFPVGAISISIGVAFRTPDLGRLVEYHDLPAAAREARMLAEQALKELQPWLIQPTAELRDEEAYTVFCLDWPLASDAGSLRSAEAWLRKHRRQVAALLTQESHSSDLSTQEIRETAGKYLSYYDHDLLVVDWDAALLVDERSQFSSTLHVLETANVQLAELEVYDRILNSVLHQAYRDVHGSRPGRSKVLRQLREIRIDLTRLSDELSNTVKFLGEWHLARVYQAAYDRFHLQQWEQTIDGKLKAMDQLYQLLKHDQTNAWMIALETAIVVLFVLDVIMILLRH